MKRIGYRRWHRVFCIFGHKQAYSRRHFHSFGHLDAYEISCLNCGKVLDAWDPCNYFVPGQ